MYYLLFGFFYLISFIPFPLLYLLSDVIWFFLFYVVRYRRKVVMYNLSIAFPEKTLEERKAISRKFYRRFTDNWLEAIKLLSMSDATIRKRMQIDFAPIEEIYESGRCCHFHLGHHFNWEWLNVAVSLNGKFPVLGIYQPISNKAVDRLFRHFRSKGGTILLPAHNMNQDLLAWRKKQYLMGLIADQNPPNVRRAYWTDFFSKPAPFIPGPEKNARWNDIPVVFARLQRVKRGYYKCELTLVEDHPAQTQEGELTLKFVEFLESCIRAQPETWMWTHRRWKHEWKETYRGRWLQR